MWFIPATILNCIDWLIFEPLMASQANISCKVNQWISSRHPRSSHHHQQHQRRPTLSQAERLSTQKTDGPSPLHTPRPDMQFISWKTCRRAKGGRALYLVSLHQPLLSMLHLGSFHPPADRGVYMGPSVKDLRHSHPDSLHLCPLPRLRGRSDWQGQQDGELWCSELVCVCYCYYYCAFMC